MAASSAAITPEIMMWKTACRSRVRCAAIAMALVPHALADGWDSLAWHRPAKITFSEIAIFAEFSSRIRNLNARKICANAQKWQRQRPQEGMASPA
jgi:hypothetical protein